MTTEFHSSITAKCFCFAVVFALCTAMLGGNVSAQQVEWYPDLKSATTAAAKNNKLVMMHFTASWCRPCRTLETFVFKNAGVVRAFEDNVIAVKIDVDKDKDLAQQYGVLSVPYDVAMTPSGRVVSKRKSPKDPSAYVRMVGGFSKILSERQSGDNPAIAQNLAELQELMQNKNPKYEGQPTSFTPDAPSYQAPQPSRISSELQRKSRLVHNPYSSAPPVAAPQPKRVANAYAPVQEQNFQPGYKDQHQNQFQQQRQIEPQYQVEPRVQGKAISAPSFDPSPTGKLMAPPAMQQVETPSGLDQASIEQMFASQLNKPIANGDSANNQLANQPSTQKQITTNPNGRNLIPNNPPISNAFAAPAIVVPNAPSQTVSSQIHSRNQLANQFQSQPVAPRSTQVPAAIRSPAQQRLHESAEINVPEVLQGEFQFDGPPPAQPVAPVVRPPVQANVTPAVPANATPAVPANVALPVPPRNIALQRLEQSDVAARLIREKAQRNLDAFKAEAKIVTEDKFYGQPSAKQTDGIVGNYSAKINVPNSRKVTAESNDFAPQIANEAPAAKQEPDAKAQFVIQNEQGFTREKTKAINASSEKILRQSVDSDNAFSGSSTALQQASKRPTKPEFALHGKCPVTLLTESKWVDGDKEWGCIHRNRIYIFASRKNMDLFQSDPDAYSPVLAGYDPVLFHESGKLVDGQEAHGVFMGKTPHQRIVLFANAQTRARFQMEPRKYLNAVRQAMSTNGGSSSTLIR